MFHLVLALSIALLGYLIKHKRISWLIAGYNTAPKRVKDKIDEAALCTAVGNFILLLSSCLLVGAVGEIISLGILINASWLLFIIVSIGGLIYLNTGNRFSNKSSTE